MKILKFLFLIILLYSCKNEQINDIITYAKFGYALCTVYEVDELGTRPSVNAVIIININNDSTLSMQTDSNGQFFVKLDVERGNGAYHYIANVSKKDFTPLDFYVYVSAGDTNKFDVQIIKNKVVKYFPINTGNMWKYEVNSYNTYHGDGQKVIGFENWKITSTSPNEDKFTLETLFNGLRIELMGGREIDTTYFENYKNTYALMINEGYIVNDFYYSVKDSSIIINRDLPAYFGKIKIEQSFNTNSFYEYDSGYKDGSLLQYKISILKGIEQYHQYFSDGSISFYRDYNLNLLEFSKGN